MDGSPGHKNSTVRRGGTGRGLLGATIGLVLLAAAAAYWWHRANSAPLIVLPSPHLPNLNAYDFYVRAGGQVAPGDYLLGEEQLWWKRGRRSVPLGETEVGVRQSAGALQTLRAGFAFPFQEPPSWSPDHARQSVMTFINLAALLRAEGRLRAARGTTRARWTVTWTPCDWAQDVPRGNGGVLSALVGVACAEAVWKPALRGVDRLDARAARRAARRLETINARRFPWADTLIGEKWETLALAQPWFAQKSIFLIGYEVRPRFGPGGPGPLQTVRTQTHFWLKGKRGILAEYLAYTDRTIADARLPFALRPPAAPRPNNSAATLLSADTRQFRLRTVECDTQNDLLLAALALRAYRVEKGVYPARLDELVTDGYLSRVPDDPFAPPGMPLLYRRLPGGSKYLLYSVGRTARTMEANPCRTSPTWAAVVRGAC
jgi:hypothetical protein